MPGRDEEFQRTMLERATQPYRPDVVHTLPAWNYSVAFDPESQIFHITFDTPRGNRYTFPIERLPFAGLIRDLQGCLDRVQAMQDEENENGNGGKVH